MSRNSIEVEAESIEEATERAKSLIPEGSIWFSEKIVSYGGIKTLQYIADTTEEALAKAQNEIPKNANIVEQKIIAKSKTESLTVEAVDESSARWQIRDKYGDNISIKTLNISKKGRSGLFGIGAKFNQYEVTVLFPATVEITHKSKARLIVEFKDIETRAQELISDLSFHSPDDVVTLEAEIAALKPQVSELERLHLLPRKSLEAAIVEDEAQVNKLEHEKNLLRASNDPYSNLALSLGKSRLSGLQRLRDLKSKLSQTEKRLTQAQEKEKDVRSQAALKLGELDHPIAVEPLVTALKDEYLVVRSNAIKALGNLHWQPRNISEQLLYFITQDKLDDAAKLDGPVIETLAEFLAEPSYKNIRLEIVKTLARTGDKGIVKPLITIIEDKTNLSTIRLAAIEAVGMTGYSKKTEVNDVIAQELETSNQLTSAIALGRLGDKRAAKILVAKLKLSESMGENADDEAVAYLVDATQSLLNLSAKRLDLEDLEKLAYLENLKKVKSEYIEAEEDEDQYGRYTVRDGYWHHEILSTVDMSLIRKLSQQELTRRKGKNQ